MWRRVGKKSLLLSLFVILTYCLPGQEPNVPPEAQKAPEASSQAQPDPVPAEV